MPSIEGRVLLNLSPFVNLDLFKRGNYYVSCRVTGSMPHCHCCPLSVKDFFGSERLAEHTFPGACISDSKALTQTVLIEFTEQSFVFAEYFLFKVQYPIKADYTEVYVPATLQVALELMYSGEDEMPAEADQFESVATRTLSLTIDWRKGLHSHWPVIFDYFHMAAVGVTIHASLYSIHSDDYAVPVTMVIPPSRRGWPFQQTPSVPIFVNYSELLLGTDGSTVTDASATFEETSSDADAMSQKMISRAWNIHGMMAKLVVSARDCLRQGFQIMSGQWNNSQAVSDGPIKTATTIDEVEEECRTHLEALSIQLQATWAWFCHSAVVHPNMLRYLMDHAHHQRLKTLSKTVLISDQSDNALSVDESGNSSLVVAVATSVRKLLRTLPPFYCLENLENSSNASVIFIGTCPWLPPNNPQATPTDRQPFQSELTPYLLSYLPSSGIRRRHPRQDPTHLVVCVHGLQGNQFDLRLYRAYIELALPHKKIEFLMSVANQQDTFTDFNIMTDRLQDEVLSKIESMPRPPSHISFLAHSLGAIVVRSLVTRPAMAKHLNSLHLLLSICSPHLGTQHQSGVISAGMWFVRKFYHSQSLLQLSLKDAPTPSEGFLYHLSESQTFECFKHVVLLTSTQDKYVPHQSARLYFGSTEDNSAAGKISEEMALRMLQGMQEAQVNLVRVVVHHSLPTSADSVIGRAAHVAMLDNELFVEKFVLCHLAQYFIV